MNQLPPSAAKLLEQARAQDRAQRMDLEPSLANLHAALPFADAGPALSLAESTPNDSAGGALQPDLGAPALSTSGGALLTGKLVKVFLAAITLGGAIGGASLLYAPTPSSERQDTQRSVSETARPLPSKVEARQRAEREQPASDRMHVAGGSAPVSMVRAVSDATPRAMRSDTDVTKRAKGATGKSTRTLALSTQVTEPESAHPVAQEPSAETAPSAAPATKRELDLIDDALSQLHAGQAARVLALLAEHAQRYPHGKFSTERRGLRVLALCASGQLEQGRSEQARFLQTEASAPIAARVRGACEEH